MKKKLMKISALVLALSMTIGTMVGCGEQQNEVKESATNPVTSESKTESVASETQKPQETVNIVWYREMYAVNDDEKLVEAAINEYIEPLIGVTVTVINKKEYGVDLNMALAAGEEIDLMHLLSEKRVKGLIASDSLMALDGLDIKTNYPDLYNAMPQLAWDCAVYNEKTYWIPCYKELGTGFSLMVETALVDKYGWDMSSVKSLADIEPMLAQLKADGYDRAYRVGENNYVTQWAPNYFTSVNEYAGIREDGSSTEIVYYPESAEYKEFLKMMYRWNKEGYINQDDASDSGSIKKDNYVAGENAFFVRPTTPGMKAAQDGIMGVDMTVTEILPCVVGTTSTLGSAWVINSASEKADACLKFVTLLNTDTYLADLATYGIEGKHFTKNEAGKIVKIADSGYKSPGRWGVANVRAATPLAEEADDLVAQYEEFNANCKKSISLGFSFDETPVSAEVSAISNVIAEYRILLEKGFYDPDEYLAKYDADLKSAGVEKVIAEMQKQYNAFLASK